MSHMPLPFVGPMACCLCAKKEIGLIDVETNWRAIAIGHKMYYACTDHFPPDDANADEFTVAYIRFVKRATELYREAQP